MNYERVELAMKDVHLADLLFPFRGMMTITS